MKKNKKLFAILTLVAFMMTLVPALAFAEGGSVTVAATGTIDENGVELEATATGFTGDISYEWKLGNTVIEDADSATYLAIEEGTYTVTASAGTGEATVSAIGKVVVNANQIAVYKSAKALADKNATIEAWNAVENAGEITQELISTFAAAQAISPITGADADRAAWVASNELNPTTVKEMYAAEAAFDAAVEKGKNLTASEVSTFKEAYKEVAPSAFATFAGADKAAVATKLAAANTLEEAKEAIGAGETPAPTPGAGTIDFTVSVFGAKYANGGNPSVNSKVQTNVLFMNKNGKDVDNVEKNIIIWAEDVTNTGVPTTALDVEGAIAGVGTGLDNETGVFTVKVKNDQNINLIFSRAGEYNIYAAEADQKAEGKTVAEIVKNTTKMKLGNSKVVVNDLATDPRQTYTATINGSFWSDGQTLKDGESSKVISVRANNVATTNVTVTMKNEGNRLVGKTVNIESNSANLTPSKKSAVTNSMGQIDFDLSGSREGTYYVFLSCDGFEVKLQVTVGNTAAAYIAIDSQPDAPIALFGNSDDLDIKVNLTDINGNVVTGASPEGAKNAFDNTTKYVSFTEKPAGTNLKDKDLSLAYNSDDEYYVKVAQTFDKEGTYEIKVVLDNGNYVVVPFEVKRFETPVQILLDYNQSSIELNGTSNVPSVKYVDANGVKQNARNKVTIAATGYAIAKFDTSNGRITVKNDEKYIGQTITVTAVDSRYNLTATQTLTVADEAQGIKFDTNKAQVNVNNKIDFHVTDANGNTVALGNNADVKEVNFIITSKPEGAKVSAVTSGNYKKDLQSEGKATMALTSDKEGEVTVQVLVSVEAVSENSTTGLVNKYYTGTETFKVTKEIGKGSAVVMTIGSATMVVNDTTVAIDSPAMIKDNRTFVPVRALMEAFGATVDFDEATNKVTIKADGKTIELTLGSTVMTVGDKAVTMDVAAFATNEGRTMVPVRAIAEAAGYTVEATYNADGTTASVVFTK